MARCASVPRCVAGCRLLRCWMRSDTPFHHHKKLVAADQAYFKVCAKSYELLHENRDKDVLGAWAALCGSAKAEFPSVASQAPDDDKTLMNLVVKKLEGDYAAATGSDPVKPRVVMFTDVKDAPPLIVVKSDGGYTYDTSDLATLRYRVQQEKADWVVYVVDAGQATHFNLVFAGGRAAGYYDPKVTRINHVGFGLVLGADKKKFKTRSGDTVQLKSLLDEGIDRSQQEAAKRREALAAEGKPEEAAKVPVDDMQMHEAIAYGCIKYADLSHNRTNDYVFSFDKMLDTKGNTAVYLLYARTRIMSVFRQPEIVPLDIEKLCASETVTLELPCEMRLATHLLKFPEVLERVMQDLMPHYLCDFLYELSGAFTEFYEGRKIISKPKGQEPKVVVPALLLAHASYLVMNQCFQLLGIRTVDRM
eukprot:m.183163 g.183163  ORF g.183163 m.183163 type:complete len:420 (+) comp18076_c0_seq1:1348-2607(+)